MARLRRQWVFLALLLGAIGITVWMHLARARTAALQAAEQHLAEDADAAARIASLAQQTTRLALVEATRAVSAGRSGMSQGDVASEFARIERMVPSVQTLSWLDANGKVMASNRPELTGRSLAHRPFFTRARALNDPELTQLSEPSRTVLGVWTMNMSVSLRRPDGSFGGLVAASLDPSHLHAELRVLHRAGLGVRLLHDSGRELIALWLPEVRASAPQVGTATTTQGVGSSATGSGPAPGNADDGAASPRLEARRPLAADGIEAGVSRLSVELWLSQDEVLAPWRTQAGTLGGALAAVALIAIAALAFMQRQEQRTRLRLQAAWDAASAAQAERQRHTSLQSVAARAGRLAGWWIDAATGQCHWTDELRELLLLAPGTPASLDALARALDPHGALGLRRSILEVLSGASTLDTVVEVTRDDEGSRFLRIVATHTRDVHGTVTSVEGAAADVTAASRSAAALKESESLFRGVFENAAAGIAVLSVTGEGRRANRRFAEMLGWTQRALDALTTEQLVHPEDLAAEQDEWREMCLGHLDGYTREKRLRCSDGQWRWTNVALAGVRDAGRRPAYIIAVVEDITQRKAAEEARRQLESELRQSQKMEAIGTLAGGVAHDFNNVLGVMLANAEALRAPLAKGPTDSQEALEQIFKAGLLGRELVARVLAFSRRQPGVTEPLDLRGVAQDTVALLRSTAPAHIEVTASVPPEPVMVVGVVQQLQQVLLNLATNAIQAIGDNVGHVTVRLTANPACARLEVSDDGCGMSEAVRERMFEPFFTTKAVGQGTGLGLSVARSIVLEHGGSISTSSEPGLGTTIAIDLPRAEPQAQAPVATPPASQTRRGNGEHIVYVDDNKMMAAAARRLLERNGYRVTSFTSPAQALGFLADADVRVDALVTDFSMPELSGLELVDLLAPPRRSLPVVLVSGFVSDELCTEAARRGIDVIVRKEDAFSDLAGSVGLVIGKRRETSPPAHAARGEAQLQPPG